MRITATLAVLLASAIALPAAAQTLRPDQSAFRALYKELVEPTTTLSVGSCTDAAAKMGASGFSFRSAFDSSIRSLMLFIAP